MIEFKKLTLGDEELLKQTVYNFRQQEITTEKATSFLSNPTNIVEVAIDEGKVVGYALAYQLNRMDNGKDFMLIFHLFVAEDHQRKGIARTIMTRLLDYAKKTPLHYVLLITQTDNSKARALYESLGGYNHPDDKEVYFWYITGRPVTDKN